MKPVSRPPYVSSSLLPQTILSASSCVCPQFPSADALDWVIATDEERAAALDKFELAPQFRPSIIEWASATFGNGLGWPTVFYDASLALEAVERFFPHGPRPVILGLGLPEQFAESFIGAATPEPSPPGYAPMGESGYLECVKQRAPVVSVGSRLGYELLNLEIGVLDHSWLCNGLEKHCVDVLNICPSSRGFLETFEEASRCIQEITRDDVGAEPGPWYPILLTQY